LLAFIGPIQHDFDLCRLPEAEEALKQKAEEITDVKSVMKREKERLIAVPFWMIVLQDGLHTSCAVFPW